MNSTEQPRISVRSPADLIAAVPYLLGFHPADSLVVLALRGRRIVFAARADLPPSGADAGPVARHLTAVIRRQSAEAATIIGYGPAARVTAAVDALRHAVGETSITVVDALRVGDGRYWSYVCADPGCCPPEGTPYDAAASQVTATAVFAGQVALPDRAALTARVAPVTGPAREAMRAATAQARARLGELLRSVPPEELSSARAVTRPAGAAHRAALEQTRRGERLSDQAVAWLGVLLTFLPARDDVWERTEGDDAHVDLWTDVFRRSEPELVAAPGSLLAFAAFRAGQGALAAVALERVLARQPDYSMALLLDDLLRQAVPPSRFTDWPTLNDKRATLPRRARRHRPR
ncbi:DUF4192 domain-containing protein [Micromonospora sp. WMMD882]|uniref:DUF4192 domain-containing protein n=1 Tax=Micromonospora sp. WMMD882 TaxID=3015151 RepID=UPI00248B17FE|nr:DUF4192 domain-containing protein [Micromonospora sp. WMMD882]WBB78367.1 DUF4192 domain-containing protein [Micromonospora sp. WMMD882]